MSVDEDQWPICDHILLKFCEERTNNNTELKRGKGSIEQQSLMHAQCLIVKLENPLHVYDTIWMAMLLACGLSWHRNCLQGYSYYTHQKDR